MSAFIKKGRLLLVPVFILFLVFGLHKTFQKKDVTVNISGNDLTKYRSNNVIIHQYLFRIYNLAACGKTAEAENEFLDMKQLWFMQIFLQNIPWTR
ncbi:hypothetical protein [Dyadobacter sp. NIV53]|uniref:hypothetical protein n=1 Tax=Dyadobacter sp. NIV53 TaxID=2861765 RepID=UPI001C88A818|nr:hypothetical protein [Dyadobacter sp. NIV53]